MLLDLSTSEIHQTPRSESDSEDSYESTAAEKEAEMVVESSTLATDLETPAWSGYVIVGDNVDKNIRHSFQRVD